MTVPVFSVEQINKYLLRHQHLREPAFDVTLVQTIEAVGGLHATAAIVPYLSLWARRKGFDKTELQAALYDEHAVARVLCMRNTLFILPNDLLPAAYQATKKRRDATIDRYLRHYGISRSQYQRTCAAIRDSLGDGAKTTAEIKEEFVDDSSSIVVDLMPHDWQLVRGRPRGTWRSNLHEYGTFEAWFPDVDLDSLTPEEAQAILVEHYLASLGPGTEEDIVWWTGLGKLDVRRTLAAVHEDLVEVQIEGLEAAHLVPAEALGDIQTQYEEGRSVFLLPGLDPYVMGYKDRRRFLPPNRYDQVFDRAGNALPTVWHNGQVIGVWLEEKKRTMVEVLLFIETEEALTSQVESEAQRLSSFLEHEPANVQIKVYPDDLYPKTPFTMARRQ